MIRWLGHVKRMEAGAMPRRMMEGRLFTGRRKGRPRLKWMDDVLADLSAMRIQRWTEKAEDRQQRRLVVKEAKQGSPRAAAPSGWMEFSIYILY
jgi:hypothetical protein